MKTIIVSIVFIAFLQYVARKNKSIIGKRLLSLYIAWWGGSLFLSTLGLYGFPPISSYSLILMVIHLLFFYGGYRTVSDVHSKNFSSNHIQKTSEKIIKNKIFIAIILCSLLYTISLYKIFVARLALAETMGDVRTDFYSGDLYGSAFSLINGLVLSPLNYVCLPIFSYTIFKKRGLVCILSGLYLIIYASLGGGRISYVWILLNIIFLNYCIFNINLKKYVLPFSLILVLGYFSVSYITAARFGENFNSIEAISGGMEKTNEQILSYSAGSFAAFDYAIEHDYVGRMGGYQCGRLTGASIEAFLYTFFNKFGFMIHKSLDDFTQIVQEEPILISDVMSWNALYTSLLYYYCDFGILGVCLFPFIFGCIFHKLINLLVRSVSFSSVVLLGFFFQRMIYSTMSYGFTDLFSLFFVIIVYIIAKQKKTYFP